MQTGRPGPGPFCSVLEALLASLQAPWRYAYLILLSKMDQWTQATPFQGNLDVSSEALRLQAIALDDADMSAYLHYLEHGALAGAHASDGLKDIITAVQLKRRSSVAETLSAIHGHEGQANAGKYLFYPSCVILSQHQDN